MRICLLFFCFFMIFVFHSPFLFAQNPVVPSVEQGGVWVFDESGEMVKTQQPIFQFPSTRSYNFGTVQQSEWISYDFVFTNTGSSPLLIKQVKGSCYCTKAEWSTQAIKTGEQGYIRVFYDTRSKVGKFRAAVSIMSNAYGSDVEHLFVEGEITP